jgi:hypothetical protein
MSSMVNAHRAGSGGLAKLGEGARTTNDSRVSAGLSRGANLGKKLNAAPWSDTFPAADSTLDLDFANNRGFVRGVGQGGVMDAITFTRASNGTYVNEQGLLVTHANQGALGNNLLTFPQDFDNSAWIRNNVTVIQNAQIAPNNTLTAECVFPFSNTQIHAIRQNVPTTSGTFSVYVAPNGYTKIMLYDATATKGRGFNLDDGTSFTVSGINNATTYNSVLDNNGFYRFSISTESSTDVRIYIINDAGAFTFAGEVERGIFIWGAQLEVGSTATEYFPTNIGQPRFDWASTDSTGAGTIADPRIIPLAANPTSNGLLIEEARTNRLFWNRDATQTEWVKTNVTAAKDQTGIDGVANAASSLTATANDGTCIQTITLATGNRTGSVFLKRITGTGNIQVTLDGSTYSTVELSDTLWYRIVLSGNVTNPTVGIRLAVSGDAVAMDYGQVEDGVFATSPILTTTATVTRSADFGTLFAQNFGNNVRGYNKGTFFGAFKPLDEFTPCGLSMRDSIGNGNVNNMILSYIANTQFQCRVSNQITSFINVNMGGRSKLLFKAAISFTSNNCNGYATDGNLIASTNFSFVGGSQPIINSFVMSDNNTGTNRNMYVNRAIFYPDYMNIEALKELTK